MPYVFNRTPKNRKFLLGTVIIVLLLSACSWNSGPSHQIYLYHGPAGFDGTHFSGDQILVQWVAQPGPLTNDTVPAKVILNVELVGPFSSVDPTLRAIGKSMATSNSFNTAFAKEMIVVSAQPIQTDNWTKRSFTSTFIVPPHLKTGYYDLLYAVTSTTPGKSAIVMRKDTLFHIN